MDAEHLDWGQETLGAMLTPKAFIQSNSFFPFHKYLITLHCRLTVASRLEYLVLVARNGGSLQSVPSLSGPREEFSQI